jgi:acyl carrier protein
LDFFVSFSSLAQVLGSIGQASYVAANAFLDAFADYRQGQGRAGQTIDWGALGESGFVARSDSMTNYLESVGLSSISNENATNALGILLRLNVPSIAFAAVDWDSVARGSSELAVPRLENMLSNDSTGGGRIKAGIEAAPRSEWVGLLTAFLVEQVSTVLKVDKSAIGVDEALMELGFDSLSSIELKNRVEGQLGLSIPMSAFLQTPTLSGLADAFAVALDEELRKRVASGNTDERIRAAKNHRASPSYEFRATDEQNALLAASIGPFASDDGRRVLEHRILLRFPDASAQKKIVGAFARLVKRHSLLRLTLDRDPTSEHATLGLNGQPKLVQVDDSAEALKPCLAVEDGEFVRAAYSEAGGKGLLGLVVHAAVTDKHGFLVFVDELVRLMDGQALSPKPPEKALRSALDRRRFDETAEASQSARAHWENVLHPPVEPAMVTGRRRALLPFRLGVSHGPVDVFSFDIEMKRTDADVEEQLLAAFATAVLRATEQTECVVEYHSANRDLDVDSGIVGPFEGHFPVVMRTANNERRSPERLIRRQIWTGYAHAALGTSFVETILAKDQNTQAALRQFGFRFEDAKRGESHKLRSMMKAGGQPVKIVSKDFAAASANELALCVTRRSRSKLRATMEFDSKVFSEAVVRSIADAVKNLCEESAATVKKARQNTQRAKSRIGQSRKSRRLMRNGRLPGAPAAE